LYSEKLGRGIPELAARDLPLVPPVVKVAKVVYKKPQYTDRSLSNDEAQIHRNKQTIELNM
jgi:hypothetical protein